MDGRLNRPITHEEIETYQQDGIVCLLPCLWGPHTEKFFGVLPARAAGRRPDPP